MSSFPGWAVVHVPHDSTQIPDAVRDQFLFGDEELRRELVKMTDHHTHAVFAGGLPADQVVRFPVSRLVVDVERFERDEDEPMAERGMGAIYSAAHDLRPLRRPLRDEERNELLSQWYRPHHRLLSDAVDRALARYDRAIVIDAHSFPSFPLPYETDYNAARPQICIGADEFHTPTELVVDLIRIFEMAGLTTGVNTPFAGALVPIKHHRQDRRVSAVMIEVRRDLYLDENTGDPKPEIEQIQSVIRRCLASSISLTCAPT